MSYSEEEVKVRAARYAAEHGLVLEEQLGYGVHGVVWSASRRSAAGSGELSAVKVHAPDRPYYARERDIYLRLRECDVTEIRGFNVPRLVDYDDRIWVIEMAIVQPPFVLDFAGAYLDEKPDWSGDTMPCNREAGLPIMLIEQHLNAIRARPKDLALPGNEPIMPDQRAENRIDVGHTSASLAELSLLRPDCVD
jgi:hypothetical protein